MTSHQKIKANAQNARLSTGPRTERGKQCSSRNARRHGLAAPIWHDPHLAEGAKEIVDTIIGDFGADPQVLACARIIAEAQTELIGPAGFRRDYRSTLSIRYTCQVRVHRAQDLVLWNE